MSVTIQVQDFEAVSAASGQLDTAPEAVRSAARKVAAQEYSETLRGMPMVDDGSLYPVLNRYRARLVEIDEQFELTRI